MKIIFKLALIIFLPFLLNASELSISDFDFEKIISLKKELSEGNYSNIYSQKYSTLVSDAAIQLWEEEQLHKIATGISLRVKLTKLTGKNKRTVISRELYSAYKELDLNAKSQLIPLFVNKENSETSYYFDDAEIQELAYYSYLTFLEMDKIDLNYVIREFYELNPLANSYPYFTEELNNYLKR